MAAACASQAIRSCARSTAAAPAQEAVRHVVVDLDGDRHARGLQRLRVTPVRRRAAGRGRRSRSRPAAPPPRPPAAATVACAGSPPAEVGAPAERHLGRGQHRPVRELPVGRRVHARVERRVDEQLPARPAPGARSAASAASCPPALSPPTAIRVGVVAERCGARAGRPAQGVLGVLRRRPGTGAPARAGSRR